MAVTAAKPGRYSSPYVGPTPLPWSPWRGYRKNGLTNDLKGLPLRTLLDLPSHLPSIYTSNHSALDLHDTMCLRVLGVTMYCVGPNSSSFNLDMQASTDTFEDTSDGKVKGACGIPPEAKVDESPLSDIDLSAGANGSYAVVASEDALWDNGFTISYSFFDGTELQRTAVEKVAIEWTYYANLTLQRQDAKDNTAMVRIAFQKNAGSWSSIGKHALDIAPGAITMNLGWIDDSPNISTEDRGTILHEWGHALGLLHEHQSLARGGTLTLNETEVYKHYRNGKMKWSNALIKSQILDLHNKAALSNYSKLDINSIMMHVACYLYFMPSRLNNQKIAIGVRTALSDLDKAYMVINYPRKKPHPKAKQWTLEKALEVAGVPSDMQTDILEAIDDASTLRTLFSDWNQQTRAEELEALEVVPVTLAPPVPKDLAAPRHGIKSVSTGSTTLEVSTTTAPALAANVPTVAQHSIDRVTPSSIYPSAPILGSTPPTTLEVSTTTAPAPAANVPTVSQHTINRVIPSSLYPSPPMLGYTLPGPIAPLLPVVGVEQDILTGVINAALAQQGLYPQTTAVQYPYVQQGIWSSLGDLCKNPAFQHFLSAALGPALNTQRSLQVGIADQPAVQYRQGLTDLAIAALFQQGLNIAKVAQPVGYTVPSYSSAPFFGYV
ncbi:hypothetical protein FPV67DRAFT_1761161 [Lyophyllum atratum]|nr:hypothetical protein FPV67DRAFT_1761161 [Lyophyllum atratum]